MFASEYQDERKSNEQKFHELASRGYAIDPNNPEVVSGYSRSFNLKKDFSQRLKYAKAALELNPSHAFLNNDYGLALCNIKRFEECETHIEKAMEFDPIRRHSYEQFLPLLFLAMRESKKALEWSNILHDRNGHSRFDGFRAAIFVHLDDIESGKAYLKKFKDHRPEIANIEDYKEVTPEICEDYLMEGLGPIWSP